MPELCNTRFEATFAAAVYVILRADWRPTLPAALVMSLFSFWLAARWEGQVP